MQEKIVIDAIEDNKSDSFILKLNNTEDIATSLHINFENAINNSFKEAMAFNIKSAESGLEICKQLADEENSKVKTLISIINGQKIILNYNNKDLNLENRLNLLKDINIFFRVIACQYNPEVTEEFKEINLKVTQIRNKILEEINSLDFNNLEENIYNSEIIKDLQVYRIDKGLKDRIIELSEKYIKNIESRLKNLKDNNIEECKISLIKLLDKKYEEEFYESNEFLSFVNVGIKGFENYNDLLGSAEESYLLYKFNLNHDFKYRFEKMYELNINSFIKLPIIYKRFLIDILEKINEKYNTKEELIENIDRVIDEFNFYDKKSFPL